MRTAIAAVLSTTLVLAASASAADFARGTVVISKRNGTAVRVSVEIAETDEQRALGLMYRTSLPRNAGMMFLYRQDVRASFWMKNTRIPLAIAFANSRGRILRILVMAPCTAEPCPVYDPKVSFRMALEVNKGSFSRWRVRVGDRMTLRRRAA